MEQYEIVIHELESRLEHLSFNHDWLPLLVEDWILHVYLKTTPHINGKLSLGSPYREELDLLLKEKKPDFIRGLYLFLQPLKPQRVLYGQWESWQYAFKNTLLKSIKKGFHSVYCPYRCVLFDSKVKNLHLYTTPPRSAEEIGESDFIILEEPVIDTRLLDSLFLYKPRRQVFSIGNVILAEQYKQALEVVQRTYDITIYQSNAWLMFSYHPRSEEARGAIGLVDCVSQKTWCIPFYALASVKPSSYLKFSVDRFFEDIDMKEATEFNQAVTKRAFSGCNGKVNSLKNIDLSRLETRQLLNYRRISGPAIILWNNTSIILGHNDKNIAVPREALAIIPSYLKGSLNRDCKKKLKEHALSLLNAWIPFFDSLSVMMDSAQKAFWAHYINQQPIVSTDDRHQSWESFIKAMKGKYGSRYNEDTIRSVILMVTNSAESRMDKARAAYEISRTMGWYKGRRYPTEEWAQFYNENKGTFRNAFTQAKGLDPQYADTIDLFVKQAEDNSSSDVRK